jgi:CspA family cold shock protein
MNEAKLYGRVKWFDPIRGYGFVTSDSGEHVFLHFSEIMIDGYKTVEAGQTVAFYITREPKGLNAVAVELIEVPTL